MSVMAASTSGKCKFSDENRLFQDEWANLYLFVRVGENSIRFIYQESVAALKEYNIKRDYDSKHSCNFAHLQRQLHVNKMKAVKK